MRTGLATKNTKMILSGSLNRPCAHRRLECFTRYRVFCVFCGHKCLGPLSVNSVSLWFKYYYGLVRETRPRDYFLGAVSKPRCCNHSSARFGQSEAVPKSGFMPMPCEPCSKA
jgi:hypothetical protein